MNRVLIVIDMQNDFISGSLAAENANSIVKDVIDYINVFNGKIFYTLDTHYDDYLDTLEGKKLPIIHCIKDTYGWEIPKDLYKTLINKNAIAVIKSSFGSSLLAEQLYNQNKSNTIDEIVLLGICTDICVVSNALLIKSFLPDVKLVVESNLCAGVTNERHLLALQVMEYCHIDIN